MTFLGKENDLHEEVLFSLCAAASFLLFSLQVVYLQKLNSLSVRLLPLLSLILAFESCVNAVGDEISEDSIFAHVSVVVLAFVLPLFFVVLFELPFRLHEARSAHFMCIPFEQGEVMYKTIANVSLYSVRIFAFGLLVMNILVNLDLFVEENDLVGVGGYSKIKNETTSIHFWLSLVPSMVLSVLSLFISILMQRYARNYTLGIRNSNHYWRYMLPCSLLYVAGKCFAAPIYRWSSNIGDVFLAIGISIMVHRVQSDLSVAGSFADFLHRSNAVFRTTSHAKGAHGVHSYESPRQIELREKLENGEVPSKTQDNVRSAEKVIVGPGEVTSLEVVSSNNDDDQKSYAL